MKKQTISELLNYIITVIFFISLVYLLGNFYYFFGLP